MRKTMTKIKTKNQHVIPFGDKWAVRGEGNGRLTSVHDTQAQAIQAAKNIAVNQGSDLVIHRSDGRVRERDSYGTDPLPPKSARKVLFPVTRTVTSKAWIERAVKEVLKESKGSLRKSGSSQKHKAGRISTAVRSSHRTSPKALPRHGKDQI